MIAGKNNPGNVYFYDLNPGKPKGADFADIATMAQIKLGL